MFSIFKRCFIFSFLFLVCTCSTKKKERKVQRSFYYWKTAFNLTAKEEDYLKNLSVQALYIKFFDVDWNSEKNFAEPAAKSIFLQKPPAYIVITPVVFITNETLDKTSSPQCQILAQHIAILLSTISENNKLLLSDEIQLDCDWTSTTKEKYFQLLEDLKKQSFFKGKKISVTIRLHQLKFINQTGVPPADKGLLMCYNMGNLRYSQTKNSILETEELKKYISNLKSYPLPLDVALPIFDWYVLFYKNEYAGLIHSIELNGELADKERVFFTHDTVLGNFPFKKDQWLRHEQCSFEEVKKCAKLVNSKLHSDSVQVILYHLDEKNLTKYTLHELETFYNSFR